MLTPEEKAELDQLRNEFKPVSQPVSTAQSATSKLSAEEQEELQSLRQEFAGDREPSQFPVSTLPLDQGIIPEGQPVNTQQPESSFGQQLKDRAQTQLEAFGNTVSMGYLPHIQAAYEKIMGDPSGGVDEKLRQEGFTVPSQDYVNLRDENIQRQEDQANRNPIDSAMGSLGGVAVSTPVIASRAAAMGLSRGVGGFARLKDSARVGGIMGLISNPGDTENVVNPFQASDRLKNTGKGGALGAAGQGIGESVAKTSEAIKNAPKLFDSVAKVKAFKSMGAMLKDFRQAYGNNAPEEIGETLLTKNIVSAGDTLEDMASKAGVAKKEVGQSIRNVYSQVKEALNYTKSGAVNKGLSLREKRLLDVTKLDGNKLAETASGRLGKNFKNNLDNSEAKKRVVDVLENLKNMGDDIDLQDLIDARVNLDESINYSKKLMEQPVVQQQLKTVRDTLHKSIQNRVRVIGKVLKDDQLISRLKQANKEYGHLATAERIAKDKISRNSANNYFSLGDNLTGGAVGVIGASTGDSVEDKIKNGLIGLVGGRIASKSARYSLPVISKSAQRLGEALKKPANFAKYGEPIIEAAKRSPEEFQAFLNQLGKDPEFIRILNPQGAR